MYLFLFCTLLLPPTLSIPTGIGSWFGRQIVPVPVVSQQNMEVAGSSVSMAGEGAAGVPAVQSPDRAPAIIEPTESAGAGFEPLTWQEGVLLLWSVGVIAFAGLVVQRWFFVRRLIAQGQPGHDDLAGVLDQCRRRMGVRGGGTSDCHLTHSVPPSAD